MPGGKTPTITVHVRLIRFALFHLHSSWVEKTEDERLRRQRIDPLVYPPGLQQLLLHVANITYSKNDSSLQRR